MKYAAYIILGVVVLIAFGFVYRFYKSSDSSNLEMPSYEVLVKEQKIEVRAYSPFMIATTNNHGDYKKSMSNSFRRLAAYIFGNNKESEKIAMTAPVLSEYDTDKSDLKFSFMVPSKFNNNNLPTPNDSLIDFKNIPARTLGVIRFGGFAKLKDMQKKGAELKGWLDDKGYKYNPEPIHMYYNPPYVPFNRRNEVGFIIMD